MAEENISKSSQPAEDISLEEDDSYEEFGNQGISNDIDTSIFCHF